MVDKLEWLNNEFVQRVLQYNEYDTSINVTNISAKPATSKGDNYASDMYRVTVKYTQKEGKTRVNKETSIVCKFEPLEEDARREAIMSMGIFENEIFMMSNSLRKMQQMLGTRLGANVLYFRMERPVCLILEDLARLGFRMADRFRGLDFDHSKLTLQSLGKFHAASVALCEKEPKLKTVYQKGILYEGMPTEFKFFFISAIKALGDDLANWPQDVKRYQDKVKKFAEVVYDRGIAALQRNDDEFNVINHGDSWTNNMMYRYDENSKPVQHVFVDYQMSIYTSPAIDLLYFLNATVQNEVNTENLIEEYVNTLTSTMKRLGCKTAPPTVKDIKRYMRERIAWGMVAAATVLPFTLMDKSQVVSIDELIKKKDTFDYPGTKNPMYRKVMAERLAKFEEAGVFD